jgi:predicted O-methyltransferase YrrM
MNFKHAYSVIDQAMGPSASPLMDGWCTVEKAVRLVQLCAEHCPRLGVELGVFGGRSLLAMALGCASAGRGRVEGIDAYTVDAALESEMDPSHIEYWRNIDYEKILRSATDSLEKYGVSRHATILRSKSLDSVSRYADGSIDILHQDSNHSPAVSCAEIDAFIPKVVPGGIWVMDDIDWPSTVKAQQKLLELGARLVETYGKWGVYRLPA